MPTAKTFDDLFDSGPFPHFHKSLGLFRPVGLNIRMRAVMTVLIGWFPLLVIVAAESIKVPSSIGSFLTDVGIHARSLIAAPLLIISEGITIGRLEAIVRHFVTAGLIEERDRPGVRSLFASTRSLTNSTLPEIVAIISAYLIAFVLFQNLWLLVLRPWAISNGVGPTFSVAGWWYIFVSMPLLLILFFGWLWRIILWSRFLINVSRFPLRLVAAHPDRASGLKFLNASLFAFMPIAFTLSVIAAGSAANRILHQGATIEDLQKIVVGLVVFVLVLFVSPLLVFIVNLRHQKVTGVFSYGELADKVGRQFEDKWLDNYEKFGSGALEATDFSATTDLYQVVANVHEMKALPFELRALVALVVTTLLPFIPVVMMMIPIKQLAQEVIKLLV